MLDGAVGLGWPVYADTVDELALAQRRFDAVKPATTPGGNNLQRELAELDDAIAALNRLLPVPDRTPFERNDIGHA